MNSLFNRVLIFLSILILSTGCSNSQTYVARDQTSWEEQKPPVNEGLIYRMLLIGDAGAPSLDIQEPTLKLFQSFLEKESERSAAIFLGDNIYTNGLPDSLDAGRPLAEQRIIEQLKVVEDFKGRVVFIPGNHDWDDGNDGGLAAVQRQEVFIETYLNRGNTFLPDGGFPGPIDLELMDDDEDPRLKDDIRLLVLDTQWWLHEYEKTYGETEEYELFDGGDFLNELDETLKKRQKDFLVVVGHHPMISNDRHGGYQPASTHLKPPVFGSLYSLYRKIFGFEQDLTHYRYKSFSNTLQRLFFQKEDLIYVSGHAHSLQYHKKSGVRKDQHYIVSGAGSKSSFVAKGRNAKFTHEGPGFVTLQFYGDGSVWMEAWSPIGDGSRGKLLYRRELKEAYSDPLQSAPEIETLQNYRDSVVTIAPGPAYDAKGPVFRAIAGNHNRALWSIEASYPVFDVSSMKGGLTPVRMGGKGQSNTLHLKSDDGAEFVLRSVDKQAGKIWGENLKKTIALDLAQDQFSILNPYGALIIPPLAEAVAVYHTNPEIYYVPNDPRLGLYAEQIGGQLALFEEKPDGDMRSVESVGFSKEVVAYREMIKEIDGDIDHRVDQPMFARARILDMLIGDWDRHSDQWRWATFEPEDKQGKIYRPIPRDRDVAFMKMTGLLPSLAKYGPFFQYQNFGESFGNLQGLGYNSLGLTRRFTNELTYDDWIALTKEMQISLSDEVINVAVRNYPKEVFEKIGEETARDLIIRRDKLLDLTNSYYKLISEVVTIPASNKRERFEIEILNNDEVHVEVFKLSGKGKLREKYFDRTFYKSETKELRFVGQGGDDEFVLTGIVKSPIKLIISGGPGDDQYEDRSVNKIASKNLDVYETKRGNSYDLSDKADRNLTDNAAENFYNYEHDYVWDRSFPGYAFSYNDDDGLFIGGGPKLIRNGYNKSPASIHYLKFKFAPRTGAASIKYNSRWYQQLGRWDLGLNSELLFPKSYKNFFGLGNESSLSERNSKYYRARLTKYSIEPTLSTKINETLTFQVGNELSITQIKESSDEPNVVNQGDLGFNKDIFKDQWFNGVFVSTKIMDVDNAENPQQGYELNLKSKVYLGVRNTSQNFSRHEGQLALFIPLSFNHQITLANRVGGAHNFGAFPFYEANTIGGTYNLRGYRGNRFAGRSTLYNNVELRLELLDFYRYLLGGRLGLSMFYDRGRIWTNGEQSDLWHEGYGGGIWFNLFDSLLINTSLGHSVEGYLFELKAGFFF